MPKTAATQPLEPSFIEWATKEWKKVAEAEDPQRRKQLEDYEFSIGDGNQWSPADKDLRGSRPMLENNRLNQYVRQIVNQMMAAKPGIQVNPVDSGADIDTAEGLQGIIRHIETESDADIAYIFAGEWQVRSGVGYVRVVPEYEEDDSGNQRLTIKAVPNRMTVYDDPASTDPAGKDRNVLFATEWLEEDEYIRRYPKSQVTTRLNSGQGFGDCPPEWFKKGSVLIAEVFRRRSERKVITLANGKTREKSVSTVSWALINGLEILEGDDTKTGPRELPIPYIPFARAIGEVFHMDGKVDYRGITRTAKDPQKYSNYVFSNAAETIALAPKAPWVGYRPVFENHPEWDDANVKNYSKLTVEAVQGPAGELLPLPQRNFGEPPIQALALMGQWSENNLRAVIGFIDVQEQERKHEQSGKAILARQRQGEFGNSHYQHNMSKMIQHVGRILIAWIPHIYDAPRVLRILGKDDQPQTVMVYAGMPPDMGGMAPEQFKDQQGIDAIFDLSTGRYDVTVSVGQAYQTKRQEVFEAIGQIFAAAPQLIPILGDIYFENMDTPDAKRMAERMKKMLPPPLQEQQDNAAQALQKLQQQMQALGMQHEALTKELEAKTAYIEKEQAKYENQLQVKKAEFEMQIELQRMKDATQIRVKEIDAQIKGLLIDHEAAHEADALARQQMAMLSPGGEANATST